MALGTTKPFVWAWVSFLGGKELFTRGELDIKVFAPMWYCCCCWLRLEGVLAQSLYPPAALLDSGLLFE
jgi:hypothetical protein